MRMQSSFLGWGAMAAMAACQGDVGSGSVADDSGGAGGRPTSASSGGSDVGGSHGSGGSGGSGGNLTELSEDWTRDTLSTSLTLDLEHRSGLATITLGPPSLAGSYGASLEVGDLVITSVTDGEIPLDYLAVDGQLDVSMPEAGQPATLVIAYTFAAHPDFDGWMPEQGVSFLWPTFCGNLFPCDSDPSDGSTFGLTVSGVPAGKIAVYPTLIEADAPSYMPAIAVGDYTEVTLGVTPSGTTVKVWHLPGQEADAATGTVHLEEVFDFFEQTYGAYAFGDTVGTVSADWGGGDYGGMEHHPYWHVSSGSLYSEEVNAHEAAHGWYGNGVRIACWEDFVLSEGTATYMAARALGASGVDLWPSYECALKEVCEDPDVNTVALPDTCHAIDILDHPLWSTVPYMKGAFFYRQVALVMGEAALDEALADFYEMNVGKAARQQELIDFMKTKVDADVGASIDVLAESWLRSLACPIPTAQLCAE